MTKVALVTGGTRGIGEAISIALHNAGYKVAATFSGNQTRADELTANHGIRTFRWDVSDSEACAKGVEEVEKALGPIDIVVNNAGITRDGLFHKMTYEQWSEVIRTNLDSMFNMTRPVIEGMRSRSFGRIINISSINGQKGQFGQTNYSAAKAGVIGFTKALAAESAIKGVTVNCICPGYIDTEMVSAVSEEVLKKIISTIPAGRLGHAQEIADLIIYLCSDSAAFMNGAVLSINGGQYMAG
jgi:acetoacetyl-CoA reductase